MLNRALNLGWSRRLSTLPFALPQLLVGPVAKAFVIVALGLEQLAEMWFAVDIVVQGCIIHQAAQEDRRRRDKNHDDVANQQFCFGAPRVGSLSGELCYSGFTVEMR